MFFSVTCLFFVFLISCNVVVDFNNGEGSDRGFGVLEKSVKSFAADLKPNSETCLHSLR